MTIPTLKRLPEANAAPQQQHIFSLTSVALDIAIRKRSHRALQSVPVAADGLSKGTTTAK